MTDSAKTLLSVKDLNLGFATLDHEHLKILYGVSFDVHEGETVGIVGESGSGKSVTAMSIMRLLDEPPAKIGGTVLFSDEGINRNLTQLDRNGSEIRKIRGNKIAMIFQEPLHALSPVFTVGHQIAEAVWLHRKVSRKEAHERAIDMISQVGISNPKGRAKSYPHQLSGGQLQRCMIAMALACEPKLLIADEPTTALDVTIQAEILELMASLQEKFNLAIMLITHDLGIVAHNCKTVNVMYMGRIVEHAEVRTIYKNPKHPYTRGLLGSIPVASYGEKKKLVAIPGTVPEPSEIPIGCAFGPRCTHFVDGVCNKDADVPIVELDDKHWARCYRALEL
jgi:peptide/nickel transport system ATP-binding protein